MTRALTILVALAVVAICAACPPPIRHDARALTADDYPGPVRPPAVMGPDVMLRQRVTAHWGRDDARGFDAVLQKQGDVLKLVGLTPMGTPAFVITQSAAGLTFDNRTDQALPFPPRFIILDVQRVLFPWLSAGPPLGDGHHDGIVEGELVHERWRDGVLVERLFQRVDAPPDGVIRVTYDGWTAGRRAPARAELDNGWFGYRLVIETLDEQALPAP